MVDRRLLMFTWVAMSLGCGPPGEATLEVTAMPSSIHPGGTALIRVVATDGQGKIGVGTVTLKTAAGALESTELTLDTYGTATTRFTCNVSVDPGCTGRVSVTGEWKATTGQVTGPVSVGVGVSAEMTVDPDPNHTVDCVPPMLRIWGQKGVINMPIFYDATTAAFKLKNANPPPPLAFDTFLAGRGVNIVVTPLPVTPESRSWYVFLFHTEPPMTGVFKLGFFDAKGGLNATGAMVKGPDTSCAGFQGDDFTVHSLELDANSNVNHISASFKARCPEATSSDRNTSATGVVCF